MRVYVNFFVYLSGCFSVRAHCLLLQCVLTAVCFYYWTLFTQQCGLLCTTRSSRHHRVLQSHHCCYEAPPLMARNASPCSIAGQKPICEQSKPQSLTAMPASDYSRKPSPMTVTAGQWNEYTSLQQPPLIAQALLRPE